MSEKKTTTKDGRIRNITFMLYEDSCNPEWQKLLEEEHIPCMWIYHNKDVNPTGEPKKPHWHVMLCFEGKKSAEQLQYYVDLCGAANAVIENIVSINTVLIKIDTNFFINFLHLSNIKLCELVD